MKLAKFWFTQALTKPLSLCIGLIATTNCQRRKGEVEHDGHQMGRPGVSLMEEP